MCLSLFLNGKDVSDDADLSNVTIEFGQDSTNTIGYSISNEIKISGDTAKELEETFFSNCALDQCIEGVLHIDKCKGHSIPILINSRTASINKCDVKVRLEYNTEDRKCFGYFDTHVAGDCNFFEEVRQPKMRYCVQPNSMHYILFALRLIIIFVMAILLAITSVIRLICEVVDAIPFVNPPCDDIPTLGELDDWIGAYDNLITGCGRYAVMIMAKQMFEFHAKKAGCNFKSSILCQSPYDRMGIFCNQTRQGEDCDNDVAYVQGNEPLESLIEHLENLKKTFCGTDFIFKDGCIYFDDLDEIRRQNERFMFDIQEEDIDVTYSTDISKNFASARFRMCDDPTETQGNKHSGDSSTHYSQRCSWGLSNVTQQDECSFNSDVTKFGLRGTDERQSPYAPSRFMFDEVSARENGFFDFDLFIDLFRAGRDTNGTVISIFNLGTQNLIRNQGKEVDCALIVSGDNQQKCKLIVLEEGYDLENAKVEKKTLGVPGVTLFEGFFFHNYSMYYDEFDAYPECETLLDRCKREDPTKRKDLIKVSDFDKAWTCEDLEAIISNGVWNYFTTPYGKAFPNKYVLDCNNCKISFKDIKVYCD